MLSACMSTWSDRVARRDVSLLYTEPCRPIDFAGVSTLSLDAWDLTAIDGHCSDIARRLRAYPAFQQRTEDDIKALMWVNGGGKSLKRPIGSPETAHECVPESEKGIF